MINKIKEIWCDVVRWFPIYSAVFIVWLCVSMLASSIKARNELCDKNYPIERYFITNLFCEIKRGEHDG